MLPVWKKFELAIANFIAALDPQAKVFHDVLLPDKHTGTPRQRDVWIETKILQHYTIKIYVSCKHKKRKLNQQDIDAFYGELLSSGAHKGIIYSFSGFGDKAIKKAKSLGICCCKLYQNDPPDLPESLIFPHVYCCQSKLSILLLEPFDPNWNLKTWNDLLEVKVLNSDGYKSILDIIINLCHEQERMVVKRITPQQIFPSNWALELKIPPIKPHIKPIKIKLFGFWKIYCGQLEAFLLNGSYSFTNNTFKGNQITPVIDMHSPHPGPGWKLLEKQPSNIEPCSMNFILMEGNMKEAILQTLGEESLIPDK